MKKILYSVFLLYFFGTFGCFADEANTEIILNLDETPEIHKMSNQEILDNFLKTAQYFDEKYPGNKINEDLTEDIKQKFPNLSAKEVFDLQDYIRNGLKTYRNGKNLYEKIIESKLTPKEPPLIYPDEEYDLSSPKRDYIDTGDETLIVEDFKKVISYSQNPREIKSYQAKILEDLDHKDKFEEFDELQLIFSKLEFKKFFFYNLYYDNPLTGKKGIGNWFTKDNIKIRLITEQSALTKNRKINGLVHIMLPSDLYIAAMDGKNFYKPDISFAQSENLKDIKIHFPIPNRLKNQEKDFPFYSGEIAFPFDAKIIDEQKKLIFKAEIKLNICSQKGICQIQEFTPELNLSEGPNRDSAVAVYVRAVKNAYIPHDKSSVLVDAFYPEKLSSGQNVLTLNLSYPKKIKAFNIYAGNDKGQTFARPRVHIDGKNATVHFILQEKNISLENEPIDIFGIINKKDVFRFSLVPTSTDKPIKNSAQIILTMFIAALVGGFLLNFMPCVFPVLSLKILSFKKLNSEDKQTVKKSLYLTILGIWCSFALITAVLIGLKTLGENLGWGMQFQNPWFMSFIFFIVLFFIAQIWGIAEFKLPHFVTEKHNHAFIHFLTGTFAVLMATPCTAPYLGTAIGFALAGKITDIIIILSGVALGLSFPYLIVSIFPNFALIMPVSGKRMIYINRLMTFMLFLTLFWLLHIIQAQSGTFYCIRLALYTLLFWFLLWLKSINLQIDYAELEPEQRISTKNLFNRLLMSLAIIVCIGATFDNVYSAKRIADKPTINFDISSDSLNQYLKQGKTVLVIIDAKWCLTCRFNDLMVFKNPAFKNKIRELGVEVLELDWTNKNKQILDLMKKYGRSGLPFHILFSPLVPDGMILPELLDERDVTRLIENISVFTPKSK